MKQLHLPRGTAIDRTNDLRISPERTGWTYAGLRVMRLRPGQRRVFQTGGSEMAVLPLAGSAVVECEGRRVDSRRESVFAGVSDFAYVPIDSEFEITSASGGEFSLPSAEATPRLPQAYGPADNVAVEIRGAGQATRQINNSLSPAEFPAHQPSAVEVLTEGTWSSCSAREHSQASEHESILDEICYFRRSGENDAGLYRTYTLDGEIETTVTVLEGNVFLIPRDFDGPCVAAPGYDVYYLKVLAAPAAERGIAFCDDPAHHWVRVTWAHQQPDPRLPMSSAAEPSL